MFKHVEHNADGKPYVVLRAVGDEYEYDRRRRRDGDVFDADVHDAEALVLAGVAKEFEPPARTPRVETAELKPRRSGSKKRRTYKRKGS